MRELGVPIFNKSEDLPSTIPLVTFRAVRFYMALSSLLSVMILGWHNFEVTASAQTLATLWEDLKSYNAGEVTTTPSLLYYGIAVVVRAISLIQPVAGLALLPIELLSILTYGPLGPLRIADVWNHAKRTQLLRSVTGSPGVILSLLSTVWAVGLAIGDVARVFDLNWSVDSVVDGIRLAKATVYLWPVWIGAFLWDAGGQIATNIYVQCAPLVRQLLAWIQDVYNTVVLSMVFGDSILTTLGQLSHVGAGLVRLYIGWGSTIIFWLAKRLADLCFILTGIDFRRPIHPLLKVGGPILKSGFNWFADSVTTGVPAVIEYGTTTALGFAISYRMLQLLVILTTTIGLLPVTAAIGSLAIGGYDLAEFTALVERYTQLVTGVGMARDTAGTTELLTGLCKYLRPPIVIREIAELLSRVLVDCMNRVVLQQYNQFDNTTTPVATNAAYQANIGAIPRYVVIQSAGREDAVNYEARPWHVAIRANRPAQYMDIGLCAVLGVTDTLANDNRYRVGPRESRWLANSTYTADNIGKQLAKRFYHQQRLQQDVRPITYRRGGAAVGLNPQPTTELLYALPNHHLEVQDSKQIVDHCQLFVVRGTPQQEQQAVILNNQEIRLSSQGSQNGAPGVVYVFRRLHKAAPLGRVQKISYDYDADTVIEHTRIVGEHTQAMSNTLLKTYDFSTREYKLLTAHIVLSSILGGISPERIESYLHHTLTKIQREIKTVADNNPLGDATRSKNQQDVPVEHTLAKFMKGYQVYMRYSHAQGLLHRPRLPLLVLVTLANFNKAYPTDVSIILDYFCATSARRETRGNVWGTATPAQKVTLFLYLLDNYQTAAAGRAAIEQVVATRHGQTTTLFDLALWRDGNIEQNLKYRGANRRLASPAALNTTETAYANESVDITHLVGCDGDAAQQRMVTPVFINRNPGERAYAHNAYDRFADMARTVRAELIQELELGFIMPHLTNLPVYAITHLIRKLGRSLPRYGHGILTGLKEALHYYNLLVERLLAIVYHTSIATALQCRLDYQRINRIWPVVTNTLLHNPLNKTYRNEQLLAGRDRVALDGIYNLRPNPDRRFSQYQAAIRSGIQSHDHSYHAPALGYGPILAPNLDEAPRPIEDCTIEAIKDVERNHGQLYAVTPPTGGLTSANTILGFTNPVVFTNYHALYLINHILNGALAYPDTELPKPAVHLRSLLGRGAAANDNLFENRGLLPGVRDALKIFSTPWVYNLNKSVILLRTKTRAGFIGVALWAASRIAECVPIGLRWPLYGCRFLLDAGSPLIGLANGLITFGIYVLVTDPASAMYAAVMRTDILGGAVIPLFTNTLAVILVEAAISYVVYDLDQKLFVDGAVPFNGMLQSDATIPFSVVVLSTIGSIISYDLLNVLASVGMSITGLGATATAKVATGGSVGATVSSSALAVAMQTVTSGLTWFTPLRVTGVVASLLTTYFVPILAVLMTSLIGLNMAIAMACLKKDSIVADYNQGKLSVSGKATTLVGKILRFIQSITMVLIVRPVKQWTGIDLELIGTYLWVYNPFAVFLRLVIELTLWVAQVLQSTVLALRDAGAILLHPFYVVGTELLEDFKYRAPGYAYYYVTTRLGHLLALLRLAGSTVYRTGRKLLRTAYALTPIVSAAARVVGYKECLRVAKTARTIINAGELELAKKDATRLVSHLEINNSAKPIIIETPAQGIANYVKSQLKQMLEDLKLEKGYHRLSLLINLYPTNVTYICSKVVETFDTAYKVDKYKSLSITEKETRQSTEMAAADIRVAETRVQQRLRKKVETFGHICKNHGVQIRAIVPGLLLLHRAILTDLALLPPAGKARVGSQYFQLLQNISVNAFTKLLRIPVAGRMYTTFYNHLYEFTAILFGQLAYVEPTLVRGYRLNCPEAPDQTYLLFTRVALTNEDPIVIRLPHAKTVLIILGVNIARDQVHLRHYLSCEAATVQLRAGAYPCNAVHLRYYQIIPPGYLDTEEVKNARESLFKAAPEPKQKQLQKDRERIQELYTKRIKVGLIVAKQLLKYQLQMIFVETAQYLQKLLRLLDEQNVEFARLTNYVPEHIATRLEAWRKASYERVHALATAFDQQIRAAGAIPASPAHMIARFPHLNNFAMRCADSVVTLHEQLYYTLKAVKGSIRFYFDILKRERLNTTTLGILYSYFTNSVSTTEFTRLVDGAYEGTYFEQVNHWLHQTSRAIINAACVRFVSLHDDTRNSLTYAAENHVEPVYTQRTQISFPATSTFDALVRETIEKGMPQVLYPLPVDSVANI